LEENDKQMTTEPEQAKKAKVSIQPTASHQTDTGVLPKNGSVTETVHTLNVTWYQEYTDFAVVVKTCSSSVEEELKCHKFILAQNSPVIRSMMKADSLDTKTNQMRIENFEKETVISFLNYLYAPVRETEAIKLMNHYGSKKYIITRTFETEQISLDLLKMSHIYEVEDLRMDCTEYLGGNLSDNNVVEIWLAAERMDNQDLGNKAVSYLVHKRKGKTKIRQLPGFAEMFNSLEKPIRHLLCVLAMKAGLDISL